MPESYLSKDHNWCRVWFHDDDPQGLGVVVNKIERVEQIGRMAEESAPNPFIFRVLTDGTQPLVAAYATKIEAIQARNRLLALIERAGDAHE